MVSPLRAHLSARAITRKGNTVDIRKFSVEPTARLHLRDAADELMYADDKQSEPIAVTLYGPGSKQYAKAQAAQQNRMIDKLKRKGKTEQTAEDKIAETAEFLAACTAEFENIEYEKLKGNALAIAVYSDSTIGFIADQVGKFLGEWGNFTKGSAKN
jgi:hypothetical protein